MTEYTKEESERIRAMSDDTDKRISEAKVGDVRGASQLMITSALVSLIETLEVGLHIAYSHHYLSAPEPFEGACKKVMEQSKAAIDLARANKLLPPRRAD